MSMADNPLAMMFAQHLDGMPDMPPDATGGGVPPGMPALGMAPAPGPAPVAPNPAQPPQQDPMALLAQAAMVPNSSAVPSTQPPGSMMPTDKARAAGHPPGLLKGMLMDFAFSASEAAKKAAGLPTQQEEAEKEYAAQTQRVRAQADEQWRASQIQAAQARTQENALRYGMVDATDDYNAMAAARGKPVLPPGTLTVPAKDKASIINRMLSNDPAEHRAVVAAASKGWELKPDGTISVLNPDMVRQNPILQSTIDLQNATANWKSAAADLASNPNNPVNQMRYKNADAKLAMMEQSLNLRAKQIGINQSHLALAQQLADWKMGQMQDPNTPDGQQYASLTPPAQKVLMSTEPVRQQILDVMERMKNAGLDKDTEIGKFAKARLAYGLGMGGTDDENGVGAISNHIGQISMLGLMGAARILAGSSRSYQALQQGEVHLPNYKDMVLNSGLKIYQQLGDVLKNLDDVNTDAVKFGRKGGMVPIPRRGTRDTSLPPAGRVAGAPNPTTPPPTPPAPPTGTGWGNIFKKSKIVTPGGGGQ